MHARSCLFALLVTQLSCSKPPKPPVHAGTDYSRLERIFDGVLAERDDAGSAKAAPSFDLPMAGSGAVAMTADDAPPAVPTARTHEPGADNPMYGEIFDVDDPETAPDAGQPGACAMGDGGPHPPSVVPDGMPPADRELASVQFIACARPHLNKDCEVDLQRADGLRNADQIGRVIRYDWAWMLGVGKDIGIDEHSDRMGWVLFGFLAHEYGHYLDYRFDFSLSRRFARVFSPAQGQHLQQQKELWADYVAGCVLASVIRTGDDVARHDLEAAIKTVSRTAVGDHPAGAVRAQALDYGWGRCNGTPGMQPSAFYPGGQP